MSVKEVSADNNTPAISGENTGGGDGVIGKGNRGVVGESERFQGVYGHSNANAGVVGASEAFDGVWGESHAQGCSGISGRNTHAKGGYGVWGSSDGGRGVAGFSKAWQGVYGHSDKQAGTVGESEGFDGVWGETHAQGFSGVSGRNTHAQGGYGVWGSSDAGRGIGGFSKTWQGVYGHSDKNAGVVGESDTFVAIWAETKTPDHPALFAKGPGLAARFEGDVEVTTDIRLLNADCAEDFDVADPDLAEPGTVVVFAENGVLHESRQSYDKRVAGVISGAGDYKPAIVLDKRPGSAGRVPVALLGKAFCKVDATHGAIEVGDLLTTSSTPGHAMKASEPVHAFGAVIGKALRSLSEGRGLIPVLVALR